MVSTALCSAYSLGSVNAGFIPEINSSLQYKRSISISTETVKDKVDYSPNLAEGGYATPERRARFESYRVAYSFRQSPRSLVSVGISKREINSLRDSFEIDQVEFERYYRLTPNSSTYTVDLAFGASFSKAGRIHKNSYTSYGEYLITSSSIEDPKDRTLSLNLIGGKTLAGGLSIPSFAGGGVVRSSHKSVNGAGLNSDGCEYVFNADGSGGNLTQIGTCNALLNYQQNYASEADVGNRLGFRPSEDIAYWGKFAEAGAQLMWTANQYTASLGYRYRHYSRNTIDQNIEASGNTPVETSHIIRTGLTYRPAAQWQMSLDAKYQTAPFLDDLPLLYTAFTSNRYVNKSSLSLRLGISWAFDKVTR